MNEAEKLLQKIDSEILNAFSLVPDYGSVGFIVYMHQGEPVRVESSRSINQKIQPVKNSGVKK